MFHRVKLLGGPVDIVSQREVIDFIAEAVAQGRKAIVGNQNFHSLVISRTNPDLRAFFAAADLIEIDSMPLLHWGKLLGLQLSRSHRSTYLDWRDQFWRAAAQVGWRVFLLGATKDVNAKAVEHLASRWPSITFAGQHGYFNHVRGAYDNLALLERINAFRPDVLLVGMGMPLQEIWIEQNYASLNSGVVLSVGAAFDYEAGAQIPAPPIYAELCLEWLFRLVHDPRRLFRRYVVEPWALLAPAITDLTQGPVMAAVSINRGIENKERPTIGAHAAPVISKLQRVA